MSMKFKSRKGWGGDAEVFDAAQKVHRHFSPKTLVTVHDYRTKQGRAVLKIVKAAPLMLEALKDAEMRMRSQLDLLKCDDEFIELEIEKVRIAIAAATN